MLNELINFWQQCLPLDKPPFVHPKDLQALRESGLTHLTDLEDMPIDFDSFVKGPRFGDFDDHRLRLSLSPVPYVGDLKKADIVILLLNPGFSYSNYWEENKMPGFRKRLVDNLAQKFKGIEFPFFGLDPEFCSSGGFVWWEKKLRDVASEIAKKNDWKYLDALRDLSKRVACLELVPYHSSSFSSHVLINKLPSVKMVQRFVRESLVPDAKIGPKARIGKRTLIVTRKEKEWSLPSGKNNDIVIYTGGHTRGASLSSISRGGKAILRRYGIG